MASITRRKARELQRKMQGMSAVEAKAALSAMRTEMVNEISRNACQHVDHEFAPRLAGDLLMTVLMFLRCKRGYGGKRLRDFLHDFNEFTADCYREKLTAGIVKEILMDECGFDVEAEFAKCGEATL